MELHILDAIQGVRTPMMDAAMIFVSRLGGQWAGLDCPDPDTVGNMMGGYLVYLNGKLIGDIGDNELFLKRTPTSDRLLADSELCYPYEGSKTLMHVFDRFEETALVLELLDGMYAEFPEKKPVKAKRER